MAVATSPNRQIKQSLEVFLDRKIKADGWARVTVLSAFPSDPKQMPRTQPWIAVEEDDIDKYPLELGTPIAGNTYGYSLYVSCENGGQRQDLMYSLLGDDDKLGILGNPLPVHEVVGASTGAYLFPCTMEIERAVFPPDGEHQMDRYRAVVSISVSKR
jgi:hypothetical protein